MTDYRVYNPLTGDYATFEKEEDALAFFCNLAYEFTMLHFHVIPYARVEKDVDGEKWFNRDGTELRVKIIQQIHDAVLIKNPTPVESAT